MDRGKLRRHLFGASSMVLGGGLVLTLLWAMNNFSTPPPKEERQAATQFRVEPTPKKREQKQADRPKPKPQERPKASLAPAPQLGTALSGLSFDLPAFDLANMEGQGSQLVGETSDNQVMTADAVDSKPVARTRVQPEFPEGARRRGLEGFVKLSILIDQVGAVARAKVLEAQPAGIFDEPALAAVRRWEFAPPTYQGKPVSMWAEQTLRFKLQ